MTHAPLNPRRRRLRRTVSTLCFIGLAGGIIGGVLWWKNRPTPYDPHEANADITRSLAKGLPQHAPTPRFHDATQKAGLGGFKTFSGHRTSQLPEDMGPGAAWGDFDNDGDDDLFLVSAGGSMDLSPEQWEPCRLFENLGNGTFASVTAFPELRLAGMGAAWGDYDGDGFLDLAVTGYQTLILLHNEGGSGRFTPNTEFPSPEGFWTGVTWGDFDNDRDLDLYVCGYVAYEPSDEALRRTSSQLGTLVPHTLNPSAYDPAPNLLFRNENGRFKEVAASLGVHNPRGRSLGALWHDFDDDGWLDLYVANDISDNAFYRNLGGTFEDISHPALVADYRSAMGLAAGDWDGDGDDDLFVSHWVAQENAFYGNLTADFLRSTSPDNASSAPSSDAAAPEPKEVPKNYGLRFMDIADMCGLGQIALPFVGWGAEFGDLDADGWLDLAVANGNTLQMPDNPRQLKPQRAFLFWNDRGKHFYDLAPAVPSLAEEHVSRGLALSDYDQDGDLDLLLTHLGEGVQLLRNDMATGNRLQVRLRSRLADGQPRGFGDGAKLIGYTRGNVLRRTLSSVSYLSQSSRLIHFGLGDATRLDRLEVRWLGGGTNVYNGLEAGFVWELTEGNDAPQRWSGPSMTSVSKPSTLAPSAGPRPPQTNRDQDTSKQRVLAFWERHRAAMKAMKVDQDYPRAIQLFQQALALDPDHEDARYYLAHCLASQGDPQAAMKHLAHLKELNSQSHRAFQQWGALRAVTAKTEEDLHAAETSLRRAREINPEETGALLVLAEISLLQTDYHEADRQLAAVCQSNARSVPAWFLRGYIAWQGNQPDLAREHLEKTREALGPEWQPEGTTSEGDVKRKQHSARTPLSRHWEGWNGSTEPTEAYAALHAHLQELLADVP